jgi:hypothetical protein
MRLTIHRQWMQRFAVGNKRRTADPGDPELCKAPDPEGQGFRRVGYSQLSM